MLRKASNHHLAVAAKCGNRELAHSALARELWTIKFCFLPAGANAIHSSSMRRWIYIRHEFPHESDASLMTSHKVRQRWMLSSS